MNKTLTFRNLFIIETWEYKKIVDIFPNFLISPIFVLSTFLQITQCMKYIV